MVIFYVYPIKIKNRSKHSYYIGYTSNLRKRIPEHKENKGEIKLIYYESYQSEKLAKTRERKLKHFGSAWRAIKKRLNLA